MKDIYFKALARFDLPKDICVNSLESFMFCICINIMNIETEHTEKHLENKECYLGQWEYICDLLSEENIKDTCVNEKNFDEEFMESFVSSIFFICTVTIDIVQNDPERMEEENLNSLFLIYDHICYFTPKVMIKTYL